MKIYEQEVKELYPSLYIIRVIINVISLIGCILMAIAFIVNRALLGQFTNVLTLQLCICCIVEGICYFIHYSEQDFYKDYILGCHIQGTILCTFFNLSLVFTTVIVIIIYLTFKDPDYFTNHPITKVIISISVWVVGGIIGFCYSKFGWYSNKIHPGVTLLCWFETDVMVVVNFLMNIILIAISCTLIFLLLCEIKKKLEKYGEDEEIVKYKQKLRFVLFSYLIVQIIISLGLISDGVLYILKKFNDIKLVGTKRYIRFLIRDFFECLSGLLISWAYCFNSDVKETIINLIQCKKGINTDVEKDKLGKNSTIQSELHTDMTIKMDENDTEEN